MRVLAAIIVPPHLSVSGGARAGELLSAALADHCDISVASMLASSEGAMSPAKRVKVRTSAPLVLRHPWVPRRYRSLFYSSDIPRIIELGHYNLVHLHNPMPALELERIAITCRRLQIPFIVSTHGFNEVVNGLKIYAFNVWQRMVWARLVFDPVCRALTGAAEVFALSPHDVSLIKALGGSDQNVRIVSNGVPEAPRAPQPNDKLILQRLGISARSTGSPPTFMFLANHTPNKGLPVLLEAFSRLRSPYELIVGGETRDGIDYGRAIRSVGPQQKIVVTGRLTDEEVDACFRRADAFVFPTLADTFPLVVLEAMSHGKAVIASNVGGIPFQLAGGCGRLVPPGAPERLALAIEELSSSPSILEGMGKAGLRRSRQEFTWDQAAVSALAGYEEVLRRMTYRPRYLPVATRSSTPSARLAGDR